MGDIRSLAENLRYIFKILASFIRLTSFRFSGNVVQFNFFGQTVIVLNSREAAIDLLEKRSSIYSDRPHIPIVGLMGWDFALPFMRYGDNWRRHRRIFHQKFRPEAAITFRPIQMRNVHHLLCRLTENPDDFMDCLRT